MGSCKNKAKLKLSTEDGWRGVYCFKHSFQMLRKLFRQIERWNRALYVQKAPE